MKLEYYLKINYIQLTLAFEVLDLFSRGFPDFIAKRARLAPAAARGAFIPLHPSKTAHLEVRFLRRFRSLFSKMPEDNLGNLE